MWKVYSDGKVVVSGFMLDFLEDYIIVFLGYNGVGKSIIIFMFMGFIGLMGGDVYIWGYSIWDNMNDVWRY